MTRHEKALNFALNVLLQDKYKEHIKSIILYGSCARGDFTYSSDVDLFVDVQSPVDKKTINSMKYDVNTGDPDLPVVELKIAAVSEISCIQFAKNLREEGVLLWEKQR